MSLVELLTDRYGHVMRTTDVAEVLNCHKSHVRAMCQNGQLPAVQIGSRWFIPTVKLAAVLEAAGHVQV